MRPILFLILTAAALIVVAVPAGGGGEPLDLEIIENIVPNLMVGESGPLWGRATVINHGAEAVEATAGLVDDAGDRVPTASGPPEILYPGLKRVLRYPVSLKKPSESASNLVIRLRIEAGGTTISIPATILTRECGAMIRTYLSSSDDTPHPYAIYIPADLNRSRSYPLVVSLHGAYSNYANNLRRLLGRGNRPGEPDQLALTAMPMQPELPEVDFMLLCPWGMGTMGYYGPGERDVLDVLELTMENFPVDPDRVYLTGLSMGGSGTWELGLRYPDRWAALAPVCAVAGFDRWLRIGRDSDLPENFLDEINRRRTVTELAANAINMPVYIFHGDDDPVVPVEQSRDMLKRLEDAGVDAAYFEFHNVGHNAWDPTYQRARLLEWFAPHVRDSKPARIEYITAWHKYSRAYWIEVTDPDDDPPPHSLPGRISAVVTDGNRIEITTTGIKGFKLLPDRAPLQDRSGLNVRINGRNVAVKDDGGAEIPFVSSDGKRFKQGVPPIRAGLSKKAGLEGPIGSILDNRVILVYGGGNTLDEALRFADWGELAEVNFIIRKDTELTEADIDESNLVLFGDPETNRIIARIKEDLPLKFEGDSIRLGKQTFPREGTSAKLVYPNPLAPDRLLMIDLNENWNYDWAWSYLSQLMTLPDYVVYRDGGPSLPVSKVLAWGFFDRDWSLPDKIK